MTNEQETNGSLLGELEIRDIYLDRIRDADLTYEGLQAEVALAQAMCDDNYKLAREAQDEASETFDQAGLSVAEAELSMAEAEYNLTDAVVGLVDAEEGWVEARKVMKEETARLEAMLEEGRSVHSGQCLAAENLRAESEKTTWKEPKVAKREGEYSNLLTVKHGKGIWGHDCLMDATVSYGGEERTLGVRQFGGSMKETVNLVVQAEGDGFGLASAGINLPWELVIELRDVLSGLVNDRGIIQVVGSD